MLFVAEMVSHLTLQGALDHCFSKLLQEAVVAEHIFGRLVVFE